MCSLTISYLCHYLDATSHNQRPGTPGGRGGYSVGVTDLSTSCSTHKQADIIRRCKPRTKKRGIFVFGWKLI